MWARVGTAVAVASVLAVLTLPRMALATDTCGCLPGYAFGADGVTCEATDCTGSAPCENGGVCTGSAPAAVCDCSGTFHTGAACTEDVLECATDNGGCPATATCVERVGAANSCKCAPGYRWNADRSGCEANSCTDAEFPYEVNGRWCGTTYFPVPKPEDWTRVVQLCGFKDAVVLPFTSMREYQEVSDLQLFADNVFWTSLNDRSREGTFVWSPSASYEFESLWAPGHPGANSPNDCVAIHSDGLRDETCSTSNEHGFLCVVELAGACSSTPCGTGRCINTEGVPGYTCDCSGTGFTGNNCDEEENECATDNGGCADVCVDMYGQAPTCSCSTPGYTTHDGGATCVAGDCGCAHVCTHHIDGSTSCSCRDGYSTSDDGATCVADDCTGNRPCQ